MYKNERWEHFKDDDLVCVLETQVTQLEGMEKPDVHLFVHCEIYKTTPRVIRKSREIFKQIKDSYKKEGYSSLSAYTENEKWAKLIDDSFEKVATIPLGGKNYEVLVW